MTESKGMSTGVKAVIGFLVLLACLGFILFGLSMGGVIGKDSTATLLATDGAEPVSTGTAPQTVTDPCANLTDASLASTVPISCIKKLWADKGCTNADFVPADGGWWRLDTGAGTYKGIKDDMNLYANADWNEGDRVVACRVNRSAGNPCAGVTDETLASQIPIACIKDAWKSVGCPNADFVPADGGWWHKDAPAGAGNFKTAVGNMRTYATRDEPALKTACGRT